MKIEQSNIKLPNLLAIDASHDSSSVAIQVLKSCHDPAVDQTLAKVNRQIVDKIILGTKHQSIHLLPTIDELLNSYELTLDDIDAFVLSNGPGRFTGLRIALSCIQGLAYVTNKKVITINSLLLLALQFVNQKQVKDHHKQVWICQKAYGNVYYQARYSVSDLIDLSNISNLQINTISKLNEELKQEIIIAQSNNHLINYHFIGSGWHDVFSDEDIRQATIHIFNDPINVKYCFDYANLQYANNNLLTPYEILPEYAVNPFSSAD